MSLLPYCPFLAGLVFSAQLAHARVKLPAVLGDNMVLQQKSDVNLWGEAKAGSQGRIRTSWNKKSSWPTGPWPAPRAARTSSVPAPCCSA